MQIARSQIDVSELLRLPPIGKPESNFSSRTGL